MSWPSASLGLLSLLLLSSEQDFKKDVNVRLLKASVESFSSPWLALGGCRCQLLVVYPQLFMLVLPPLQRLQSSADEKKVTRSSLCECSALNLRRSLFFRVKVPYVASWSSLVLYGWAPNCQGSRADWPAQPMTPYLSTAPGERDMG